MFAAAYFLIYASHAAATAPLTARFAVWQGLLAAAIAPTATATRRCTSRRSGSRCSRSRSRLQFDGPAVTIGWAVEGAVVIALGMRERRGWIRVAGVVLFTVAFGQTMALLSDDRAVSEIGALQPARGGRVAIAALSYALAWLHYRDPGEPDRDLGIGAGLVMAQFVTLALFTSEIHAYWALRDGHFARS